MTTLTDYTTAVGLLVPGDHPVDATPLASMKAKAVAKAMDHHSRHKPNVVIEDLDGDGGFDYAVSDLTSWADDFSVIRQVEYPVDDEDESPDILQDDDWMVYEKPDGAVLRFLRDTPSAAEDLRVTYTARHTCTAEACSVASGDDEAVQSLAAHCFCKMLSAAYSLNQDSTIEADSVDHGSKARNFINLAKQYLEDYNNHMGIVPGKQKAASITKDTDAAKSWKSDGMTHPNRYR